MSDSCLSVAYSFHFPYVHLCGHAENITRKFMFEATLEMV